MVNAAVVVSGPETGKGKEQGGPREIPQNDEPVLTRRGQHAEGAEAAGSAFRRRFLRRVFRQSELPLLTGGRRILHQHEEHGAPEQGKHGDGPEHRPPAERRAERRQRRGGEKGAESAHGHEDGHQSRVHGFGKPAAHDLERSRGHHGHAHAHEHPARKGLSEPVGRGEKNAADAAESEEQKHGSARSEIVHHEARRNLRGRVGVQEGRSQPARHGRRKAEFMRKFRHDDAETESLKKHKKISSAQRGEKKDGIGSGTHECINPGGM